MSDDRTVSDWRNLRFLKRYPGFVVDVLDANGKAVHGRTKLASVRAGYD